MLLEQSFELAQPPAGTWPVFKDIAMLVECLPGASLSGPIDDGRMPLRFDVKLGPIAAGFTGSGLVSFDDASRSGRFEGAATDKRTGSRVKGTADFTLQAHEGGSQVSLRIDYALTGALAQFNRGGIVRELANALTAQFADNLRSRLAAMPVEATDTAGAVAAEAAAQGPPPDVPTTATGPSSSGAPATAPLNGWALLRVALSNWLRRLFGRTASR